MFKILIRNVSGDITNEAVLNNQEEIDTWVKDCERTEAFGKPEHQEVDVPEHFIHHDEVPAVLDAQGNVLSPAQDAYEELVPATFKTIPAEYSIEIVDISNDIKLQKIRERRQPLIDEADLAINIAFDKDAANLSDLKAYRQALRDVTEQFKADMTLLDTVDPEAFVFPTKP